MQLPFAWLENPVPRQGTHLRRRRGEKIFHGILQWQIGALYPLLACPCLLRDSRSHPSHSKDRYSHCFTTSGNGSPKVWSVQATGPVVIFVAHCPFNP